MNLNTESRTVGGTGLSIATHLALENIFDIPKYDLEKPLANPIDLSGYTYFLFNYHTLVRNIANSYSERNKVLIYKHKDFPSVIENEIMLLRSYFQSYPKCMFVIYYGDYTKPIKQLNLGKKISAATRYNDWVELNNCLGKITKKDTNLFKMVNKIGYKFPKLEGDVIVMTHLAVDMLNKGRLSLLESHTGKLKTNSLLYTKFHSLGTRDLSVIPFLEETLYMFGDSSLITPLDIGIRRKVYDIAISKNWTYKTNSSTVRYGVYNDLETKKIYNQIKKIY